MGKTEIEWATDVWNPIVGCSIVSKGCTNCYAMRVAGARTAHTAKYQGLTQPSKAGPVWNGEVRFWERALTDPLRWREPRMVFVNSMGDLFHEAVPDEWVDRVFAVMALAPQHVFQVLTKRPERMRDYIRTRAGDWQIWLSEANPPGTLPITKNDVMRRLGRSLKFRYDQATPDWPLPNVWLGVSVEDQATADARIPLLLDTPAAVRWISAEPLLGAVDLHMPDSDECYCDREARAFFGAEPAGGPARNHTPECPHSRRLDWVVTGGESGPGARPTHPDWFRALRDQCAAAGVPFFFKQWGEFKHGSDFAGDAVIVLADGVVVHGRAALEAEDRREDVPRRRPEYMRRVGKARAGRLLDGRTHDAMPGAPA